MCYRADIGPIRATIKQTFVNFTVENKTNFDSKMSVVRMNYHDDCEALINKQINMELHASYVYMSMVS